ncbi:hypothetical protein A2U01_0099969, partial [Trifolium medium]|nr:hypothetical protein [Trifolium medium]
MLEVPNTAACASHTVFCASRRLKKSMELSLCGMRLAQLCCCKISTICIMT